MAWNLIRSLNVLEEDIARSDKKSLCKFVYLTRGDVGGSGLQLIHLKSIDEAAATAAAVSAFTKSPQRWDALWSLMVPWGTKR